MNIFSYDSILSRFLYLVADIVTLHFLWLLCSLPVFTIGASTTALYYSAMKRIRTDEGYVSKNFFKAFKANFRQSTIIWLIMAAIGIILYVDLRIGMAAPGLLGRIMLISCSVLLIPFFLILLYIFPVQAKFDNPIRDNFKNAILMSLHNIHYSLLMAAIIAIFVFLGLFYQPFIGVMLVCGAGLLGYLLSNIFVQIFRKYLPDELKHDAAISGMDRI